MKIRIIRLTDEACDNYNDMWIVEEEENMEEKLKKLRELEYNIQHNDDSEFDYYDKANEIYESINKYIYDNFKLITNYNVTDLYF